MLKYFDIRHFLLVIGDVPPVHQSGQHDYSLFCEGVRDSPASAPSVRRRFAGYVQRT